MSRVAFEGAPLSTLAPSLRGNILAELARAVDGKLHAHSTLEDAVSKGGLERRSMIGLGMVRELSARVQ